MIGRPPLGLIDALNRCATFCICAQSIDGLCWKGDQTTFEQDLSSLMDLEIGGGIQ
jgi:hypothetical protein